MGVTRTDPVSIVTTDSVTIGVGRMVGIEKTFCAIFTIATTIEAYNI